MIEKLLDEPHWEQLESRILEAFPEEFFVPVRGDEIEDRYIVASLLGDYRDLRKGNFRFELKKMTQQELVSYYERRLLDLKESMVDLFHNLYAYIQYSMGKKDQKRMIVAKIVAHAQRVSNLETLVIPLLILAKKKEDWGVPDNYQLTLEELESLLKELEAFF